MNTIASGRTFLEVLGLRVLRFKNDEVLTRTDAVIEAITQALTG